MARPAKSQWEFGELFPVEAIRKLLTVSELTGSIRRVLEKEVGKVSVLGEITNLRIQASGHVYFTIKDAGAQIACVLFRNEARAINREFLQDGQKVVVDGEVTVYEARGQYQLRVFSLELHGVGALQAAFERLKVKLQSEGLFDSAHKRPIPQYCQRIGIVSSADGAAIQDVIHTIERRNPALQLVLASCRVQGAGAAQEIAIAIDLLNQWSASGPDRKLDLILLTRGGGSLEDLWAFNEEVVARAIYASKLPVVSAVGHEIDFSISDFVADLRAATPTAAAEIITEGMVVARPFLSVAATRMQSAVEHLISTRLDEVRKAVQLLQRRHPARRLQENAQRLDELTTSLNRCARKHFGQKLSAWQNVAARFIRIRPEVQLLRRKERLEQACGRLGTSIDSLLESRRGQVTHMVTRLALLSPVAVLRRGYSITTEAGTGKIVRSPGDVKPGGRLRTRLAEGEIESVVESTSTNAE